MPEDRKKLMVLGNGFDLFHKLPTRYDNFLHVLDFLKEYYTDEMTTIGSIFGDSRLQSQDKFIAESYEKYKKAYDKVAIDSDRIIDLAQKASSNIWFAYLSKSLDEEIGWIDFEKEIARVIRKFDIFFDCDDVDFDFYIKTDHTEEYRYILSQFNFFYETNKNYLDLPSNFAYAGEPPKRVKEEYIIESPKGSKNYLINKKKIVGILNKELRELSVMLKAYLQIFVENAVEALVSIEDVFVKHNIFSDIWYTFTFNYTRTLEKAYPDYNYICHIHNDLENEIVLGINNDNKDELPDLDTTFIEFKKYHQRILYGIDHMYQKKVTDLKFRISHQRYNCTMYVVGHSLDITDKDIIKQLFEIPREIIILYHKKEVVNDYIGNLVSIYGKEEFDKVRVSKNLQFVPLC